MRISLARAFLLGKYIIIDSDLTSLDISKHLKFKDEDEVYNFLYKLCFVFDMFSKHTLVIKVLRRIRLKIILVILGPKYI